MMLIGLMLRKDYHGLIGVAMVDDASETGLEFGLHVGCPHGG